MPPETGLNADVERDRWVFPVADGTDECGAELRRLFVDGGVLAWLLGMRDREHLNRLLERRIDTRLPAGTPSAWPWRRLAMYVDDGDVEALAEMLAPLVVKCAEPDLTTPWWQRYHELSHWLRQRLDARLAERLA